MVYILANLTLCQHIMLLPGHCQPVPLGSTDSSEPKPHSIGTEDPQTVGSAPCPHQAQLSPQTPACLLRCLLVPMGLPPQPGDTGHPQSCTVPSRSLLGTGRWEQTGAEDLQGTHLPCCVHFAC